jgi:photosystem II stability/assembly factor-like uncharacterized protein
MFRSILLLTAGLCFPLSATSASLGPFGGSAAVIVADPHSPNTLVAGTRNALLFRSIDLGESWTPLPFPAQLQATLNTFVVDPQSGVYMAGLSSDSSRYCGLLRSTDAGATWTQVTGLAGERVRTIAFKRANSGIVAAGTETGVFESQDGGITWERISPAGNSQLRPIVALTFDPNDSSVLYAGTPHLPWKTSDGGLSWHSIHTGMIDDSDVFSIQVDRNRPQRVFASACSGIYRSLNGGSAWTRLSEARDTSYRTYVIVQDPQYENIWFAGTTHGTVRSVNSGETWQKVSPFAAHSISFDPGHLGRLFIATEDAGILRSDDTGKTWRSENLGFCNRRLSALWTAAGAVYTAVLDGSANRTVFRLAPDFSGWKEVASPRALIASPTAWLPVPRDRIRKFAALENNWIAAIGSAGILLSRDGRNWKSSYPPASEVYDLILTLDQTLLAATNAGLKSSGDFGASWHSVPGEFETDSIQALCRHPSRPGMLFAAKYGIVYTSLDSGRSWKKLSPAGPASSVKQLMILPDMPDKLLVLTQQQGVWELSLGDAR